MKAEINFDWKTWALAEDLRDGLVPESVYASVRTVGAEYRLYVVSTLAPEVRCVLTIGEGISIFRALDVSHLPVHDVALAVAVRAHAEVMGEIEGDQKGATS